jgi:Rrf2 family protein
MAANSQFSIAVHVLAMLAKSDCERVKSDRLAQSVNTNPVVIRRLLCSLHEANLVVSQTGACGGTCLTRDPEDISLLEVFRAVSRLEVFSLHPNTPNQGCYVGRNIQRVLGGLHDEIDRAVEESLARYTLNDVLASVDDKAAGSPG